MPGNQSAAQLLAQIPLFGRLRPKELEELAEIGKEREFEAGATMIAQGDSGLGFYLLLDGRAEVRKEGEVLRELGPQDFFGEMALLDQQPRSADVVAVEPTRCLVITSWDLHGLFGRHPTVAVGMLAELAARLRQTEQRSPD